jgi:hypothetical protein
MFCGSYLKPDRFCACGARAILGPQQGIIETRSRSEAGAGERDWIIQHEIAMKDRRAAEKRSDNFKAWVSLCKHADQKTEPQKFRDRT